MSDEDEGWCGGHTVFMDDGQSFHFIVTWLGG